MTIKIVSDSTCDLPEETINEMGISVIPLFINIGEEGYLDGVDISREEFYTNLPNYADHPSTGTPGPEAIRQVYEELISEGATEILSIHISKSLSATVDMAASAAKDIRQIPVSVLDSKQLSMGTGFQVETAARMALNGAKMSEIRSTLDDLARRTFVAAKLDTLEFLRRSGRMNAFMSGLGSVLQIKPILTMKDGEPDSKRVRTSKKAEISMVRMLEEQQPIERFALLHTNAAKEAEAFRARVSHLIPEGDVYSMDITPVIGAHVGPKAIGFAAASTSAGE